ncbi:hypothetical protein D3C71_2171340 [compost metagenome]
MHLKPHILLPPYVLLLLLLVAASLKILLHVLLVPQPLFHVPGVVLQANVFRFQHQPLKVAAEPFLPL